MCRWQRVSMETEEWHLECTCAKRRLSRPHLNNTQKLINKQKGEKVSRLSVRVYLSQNLVVWNMLFLYFTILGSERQGQAVWSFCHPAGTEVSGSRSGLVGPERILAHALGLSGESRAGWADGCFLSTVLGMLPMFPLFSLVIQSKWFRDVGYRERRWYLPVSSGFRAINS